MEFFWGQFSSTFYHFSLQVLNGNNFGERKEKGIVRISFSFFCTPPSKWQPLSKRKFVGLKRGRFEEKAFEGRKTYARFITWYLRIHIVRDEKFSCLSFSSPIRPYPCLRGECSFAKERASFAARRERKTSVYLRLESRSRETSGTRVIRPSFSWLFVLRVLHVATQSINVELGCIDWLLRPNWGPLRKQLRGLRKKKTNEQIKRNEANSTQK